jgi:foldase protein PrsA
MHEKVKRLTVYFFILALVLGNVFSGCSEITEQSTVARVYGKKIEEKDIEDFLKLVYLYMPSSQETYSQEEYASFLRDEVLWFLVENEVIEHEANRLGLTVDESRVEQAFRQSAEELINDIYGSEENYRARLKELDIDEKSIQDFHRKSLLTELLYEHVASTITEEDARAYVEENPQYLEKPAQVYAFHILLDSREKALEVLNLLQEGADFLEVGQEHSLDEYVELGMISSQDMLDPAFLEAAFALEPGEISQPVETPYGFHLIKITEKVEQGVYTFEEIKEAVINKLKSESFDSYFQKLMEAADIETFEKNK